MDIRDEALEVLQEALVWRLAGDRWRDVDRVLDDLAAALSGDRADAIREAVYDLEVAGPTRAVRIEDAAILPAPEPVRVRINELVHTLRSDERGTEDSATAAAD